MNCPDLKYEDSKMENWGKKITMINTKNSLQ
jgi:hypothetical protein